MVDPLAFEPWERRTTKATSSPTTSRTANSPNEMAAMLLDAEPEEAPEPPELVGTKAASSVIGEFTVTLKVVDVPL
ncbi:MAG: hypothetical protein AAFA34_03680 [Thermoplasmata archaeon]